MTSLPVHRRLIVAAFCVTALSALLFALYTDHVWEDYYITYRSSKNLATGHGLVFNHGDRLHTFTSPLGVLLPAVASLLTANSSDAAALWIFRAMCIAALAGAAALLFALGRRAGWPGAAAGLLVVLLATDAKSLDFTINGMETGFMLLFLAYALWAHLTPGARQWLHLGGAWAGLMWTRPDSFIYIGALAAGCWIFNQPARTGGDRRQQIGLFLQAGVLTTALYGPWLLWATWYYGTPVPHTIIAKGVQSGGLDAWDRFREYAWRLPWEIWRDHTAAPRSFLPSYHDFPTWPAWTPLFGKILGTVAALAWLLPRIRLEARVSSLAYFISIAYLSFVPYYPFPWYLPPTAVLAYVAIAGGLGQLWVALPRAARWPLGAAAALLVAGAVVLTVGTARQMRAQQQLIETGNRRVIGEWLREHARPGDTVFMEPLGYIGFFSGLKTYDWPGMSSREVVSARGLVGATWAEIILWLQPDWLVLRTGGDQDLPRLSPSLNAYGYERVRDFDRRTEVRQLDVPGRGLLEFDAAFTLYRRTHAFRQDRDGYGIASPVPSNPQTALGREMRLVHAPGFLVVPLPASARTVRTSFGLPDAACAEPGATDGATFLVWLSDGGRRTLLHNRDLNPRDQPDDRGLHHLTLDLPPRRSGQAWLVLSTEPKQSMAKDWTFWSDPEIE
jgi:hypothetical protein